MECDSLLRFRNEAEETAFRRDFASKRSFHDWAWCVLGTLLGLGVQYEVMRNTSNCSPQVGAQLQGYGLGWEGPIGKLSHGKTNHHRYLRSLTACRALPLVVGMLLPKEKYGTRVQSGCESVAYTVPSTVDPQHSEISAAHTACAASLQCGFKNICTTVH